MADEEEDAPFEEDAEEAGGGLDGGQGKRKRLFSKELRCMMYGFGDDQNPYTESVDILEDLVIEFITEMGGLAFLHQNALSCPLIQVLYIASKFCLMLFTFKHSAGWVSYM
ncbi:transcription initiation factor TFIID subunit 13 isoform X2 [Phalacrocorax carbo]|uniref:transcription initiation factor TFIID subunit 13 isoform X2 n=1 Tax=Phalacrocorax carbo TaxID=9209 RepID=UPI00311A57A7